MKFHCLIISAALIGLQSYDVNAQLFSRKVVAESIEKFEDVDSEVLLMSETGPRFARSLGGSHGSDKDDKDDDKKDYPTNYPTRYPTYGDKTDHPTPMPGKWNSYPTPYPTKYPVKWPVMTPSMRPTMGTTGPTDVPTESPSLEPTTDVPTTSPTDGPTLSPTLSPSTVCAFPYGVDLDVASFSGYVNNHFLVAVGPDNIGTAKWNPRDGYLFAKLEDFDNDGQIDEVSFSGTLVNTGWRTPGSENLTLEVEFVASNPITYADCALLGGTGTENCPKCELGLCDGVTPYVNWTYFTEVEGTISGEDLDNLSPDLNGVCVLNITGLPPVQLGLDGANVKNFNFGLSTWANCNGLPGPVDGNEAHILDFNMDFTACVDVGGP